MKLGSWCFFQFSKSWFVAASSVEAWLLIIFSLFKILVGGCKLSWSLVAFFVFQLLQTWFVAASSVEAW
jgi:hypothetical protein